MKTLVIMAAGIGSRFGEGVKQLTPVGPNGELIMDYSVHDAVQAGFDHVVFVIRRDIEVDFKEIIGKRIEQIVSVDYAYQEIDRIPAGARERFSDRKKPWGTGQAVLCCKDLIDGPFFVINADDYYGKEAYRMAADMIDSFADDTGADLTIGMISFVLGNTLSDNGSVTRGICRVSEDGRLISIDETKNIVKTENGAATVSEGEIHPLDINSPVSMNMWVFPEKFMDVLKDRFDRFLEDLPDDDLKSEYLLPILIGDLLNEKNAGVIVEKTNDEWFGMTYHEDIEAVQQAFKELVDSGAYPQRLYNDRQQEERI